MVTDDVRKVLIVISFGAAGAAIWAFTQQRQLHKGQLSLRAIFWLIAAFATGLSLGLLFTGEWDQIRTTFD